MLSTVKSIPTVELCETPVTSMLFDWAHTICYDFMRGVCRKCGGQTVDEGETRRRIQRALKTLDEWTPSHRRTQTKEGLALYPGLGHALRASLVYMADSLTKHGFEVSRNYEFSVGDFIHDTLTSMGRDPLVLTLAYFRRTPEAYTARWLLHRKCMREALVAALRALGTLVFFGRARDGALRAPGVHDDRGKRGVGVAVDGPRAQSRSGGGGVEPRHDPHDDVSAGCARDRTSAS